MVGFSGWDMPLEYSSIAEEHMAVRQHAGLFDVSHMGQIEIAGRDALAAVCDCYISLHRAEGFGLTIAEAMLLEKPTIATGYSGNLEFMTDSNSFLCGYHLRRVGHGSNPYPSDARWADPKIGEAAELMRFVYENPEEAQRRGKRGRRDLCARHDPRIVAAFIKKRLSHLRQKPPAPLPFTAQHPERALVTKVRTAIEQGVNVRRTVPSLLTWILQGPRRAMKQFLRAYDQHHRRVGLSALDAFKEIDAEWLHERALLNKRIWAQEDEVRTLKEELKEARQRLLAMEKELHGGAPAPPSAPVAAVYDRRGATSDTSGSTLNAQRPTPNTQRQQKKTSDAERRTPDAERFGDGGAEKGAA